MNKQLQYIFLTTGELSKEGEICNTAYGFAISGKDGIGMGHNLYILSDDEIKEGDWFYSIAGFKKPLIEKAIINLPKVEHIKKIIATTNPELWYNKTRNGSMDSGVEMISQSDIEYTISKYNGKDKEVDVAMETHARNFSGLKKEVDMDDEKYYNPHTVKIYEAFIQGWKTNQCLKDNTDKKFTKSDLFIFVGFYAEKKKMGKDGETIFEEFKEAMQSHSQPKSDTVMVEYEYIDGFQPSVTMYPEIQPKLKDGCIIIVR